MVLKFEEEISVLATLMTLFLRAKNAKALDALVMKIEHSEVTELKLNRLMTISTATSHGTNSEDIEVVNGFFLLGLTIKRIRSQEIQSKIW